MRWKTGIVSGYQVLVGNPADTTVWMPALQQHQACFGQAPEGKVALSARGRLSAQRAPQQKPRWFRRALRWRAGCEATISTLKHPYSMRRASYRGDRGFQRCVGRCVITKNLFSIARDQARRRGYDQVG